MVLPMKKVNDLSGAELDYWVARAQGIDPLKISIQTAQRSEERICVVDGKRYDPSTNIALGWPILEINLISLRKPKDVNGFWVACNYYSSGMDKSPLSAIMKCFLAMNKFKEVPDIERGKK